MEGAVLLPWTLAVLFALLSLVLWLRRPEGGSTGGKGAGAGGGQAASSQPGTRDPAGGEAAAEGDPGVEALRGLLRYVEHAVLPPLRDARDGREMARAIDDAMNALEDLAFYGRAREAEPARSENISTLVGSTVREYSLETGVTVRYEAPRELLTVQVSPERFRDALYLVLVNAGHHGGGEPVEVRAEPADDDRVRVTVRDRGPGFSLEALKRAFRPFWSSEDDALGLGLTHARGTLKEQGGDLRIRNREEGGAEAEILVPRSR